MYCVFIDLFVCLFLFIFYQNNSGLSLSSASPSSSSASSIENRFSFLDKTPTAINSKQQQPLESVQTAEALVRGRDYNSKLNSRMNIDASTAGTAPVDQQLVPAGNRIMEIIDQIDDAL